MAVNSFRPRAYEDHEIVDHNNEVVGAAESNRAACCGRGRAERTGTEFPSLTLPPTLRQPEEANDVSRFPKLPCGRNDTNSATCRRCAAQMPVRPLERTTKALSNARR